MDERNPVRRVKVGEIVRATGLSRATVDRALNRRPGVHPRTERLVRAAYERLAADGQATLEALPQRAEAAVEADAILRFGGGLTRQLLEARERLGVPLTIHDMYQENEDAVLALVRRLCAAGERPLVVAAKSDERLVDALARARRHGRRVVTLVSDLDPAARDAFVGIDNRMAGHTVAQLVGRFLGGQRAKVGVVLGDYAFRCHEDREIGFRAWLRAAFPDVTLADVAKGEDSPGQTRRAVLDLLRAHPDIRALYNVAGGNQGLAQALTETGRAQSVLVVTHEASHVTVPLLRDGTVDFVIAQSPADLLQGVMRCIGPGGEGSGELVHVDFAVYTRFNIPAFAEPHR